MTGQTNNPPQTIEDGQEGAGETAELDTLMLEMLVCPLTKKPLQHDRAANELISDAAGLAYPVRGGVPILLPSEARVLNDERGPGDAV